MRGKAMSEHWQSTHKLIFCILYQCSLIALSLIHSFFSFLPFPLSTLLIPSCTYPHDVRLIYIPLYPLIFLLTLSIPNLQSLFFSFIALNKQGVHTHLNPSLPTYLPPYTFQSPFIVLFFSTSDSLLTLEHLCNSSPPIHNVDWPIRGYFFR